MIFKYVRDSWTDDKQAGRHQWTFKENLNGTP